MRIGHGYDVHRLVEGRKLILGGVEIPYELGLLGHSDADVLLHALVITSYSIHYTKLYEFGGKWGGETGLDLPRGGGLGEDTESAVHEQLGRRRAWRIRSLSTLFV